MINSYHRRTNDAGVPDKDIVWIIPTIEVNGETAPNPEYENALYEEVIIQPLRSIFSIKQDEKILS